MTNETIARNYASTLFELAQRQKDMEAFTQGMDTIVGSMDQNPRFRLFLETPRISDQEKKELLEKVFGEVLPRLFLNFLFVVLDKRRQRLLGSIGEEFHALVDEHMGRTHVVVTVARELAPGALEELSRKLSSLLGREAIPHVRVKPAVLGGVHLKTGDTVYDGTLRRRIKQLRRQLVNAELPAPAPAGGES
ncbi:MAG: ATP synthase F1 subunit delta [Gemmatimonadota bacterium]